MPNRQASAPSYQDADCHKLVADTQLTVHNPGENMRVAFRRSDGGWSFHQPSEPSHSVDLHREPTATTMYTRPNQSTKETKLRPGELTTRGYVEHDVEGNPPPAYHHTESVVSDSTGA